MRGRMELRAVATMDGSTEGIAGGRGEDDRAEMCEFPADVIALTTLLRMAEIQASTEEKKDVMKLLFAIGLKKPTIFDTKPPVEP